MPLPIGLAYDAAGHVILDPDAASPGAVRHLLATFEATGSATAVVKAFNAAGLPFPWRHRKGPRKDEVDWQAAGPPHGTEVLHNPRYAGAFAYGRTARQSPGPAGRAPPASSPARSGPPSSPAPTPDTSPWTSTRPTRQAPPTPPPAAATAPPGRPGKDPPCCRASSSAAAAAADDRPLPPPPRPAPFPPTCASATASERPPRSAPRSPAAPSTRPSGSCSWPPSPRSPPRPPSRSPPSSGTGQPRPTRCAPPTSSAPSYHADQARRRYLAVDPANRLVAGTLEADWNTALRALSDAQETYDKASQQHAGALTPAQQDKIARLVTDLPGIWNDPATPQRERKRIARLLLTDVTVTRTSDTITAHVRLAGGQHRTLTIPAPLPVGDQRRTPADVLAAIDELLGQHTTGEIAGILNQRGMASGTGEPFHRLIVDHIIRTYRLRSRRSRLRATGMLTLAETAAAHHVHPHTIKAWRRAGIVSAERYNDKGEHLYYPPDPDNPPRRPKIGRRSKSS
jgi:hypothetical protein